MSNCRDVTQTKKALILYYKESSNLSYRQIAAKCGVSKSSVERIINEKAKIPKVTSERGRPKLIDAQSERKILRTVDKLRQESPTFTVKQLVQESGVSLQMASRRTFSRMLNSNGYRYLISRKKGLLNKKDLSKRLQYARKMKRVSEEFWTNEVAFYLDGVSFVHKHNPKAKATQPKGRVWRRKNEGLKITAKGSKELAGGRRIHFIVAISHGKGVILIDPYEKMDAKYFGKFVREKLNACFARAGPRNDGKRMFVMDNDPSQTSKSGLEAISSIEAEFHRIPARSPDLNPIENVFHLVKKAVDDESTRLNITKESLKKFEERVVRQLQNIPIAYINKTIESMPQRIKAVLRSKGMRTNFDNKGQLCSLLSLDMDAFVQGLLTLLVSYGYSRSKQ